MNTKISEAVILAGGLGTRLKSEVPDLPKCMAPVAGQPFLYYLITYLKAQNIQKMVFSLGYMSEVVVQYLQVNWPDLHYEYYIEDQPLGTGGAVMLASAMIKSDHFLVVNGDTYFNVDLAKMAHEHFTHGAAISIALKPMVDFERYGSVEVGENNIITAFREKKYADQGKINGGIYNVNKTWLQSIQLPKVFSFEKEILENFVSANVIYGFISDGYFIDIGVPDDYKKASRDFQSKL